MTGHARIRENAEVRRRRILDQAVGLIGERGYYGFTIQELARRCGLSNPGLLHHFPSKHAVLQAVIQEVEAEETDVMLPLVQSAVHELRGDDAKDAVLHILRTIVARAINRPDICRLQAGLQFESLDPAHPVHEWWLKREARTLAFFTDLLRPHVDAPQLVARQLRAMLDGLGLQWLRADRGFDVAAAWDDALSRLLPELYLRDASPDP